MHTHTHIHTHTHTLDEADLSGFSAKLVDYESSDDDGDAPTSNPALDKTLDNTIASSFLGNIFSQFRLMKFSHFSLLEVRSTWNIYFLVQLFQIPFDLFFLARVVLYFNECKCLFLPNPDETSLSTSTTGHRSKRQRMKRRRRYFPIFIPDSRPKPANYIPPYTSHCNLFTEQDEGVLRHLFGDIIQGLRVSSQTHIIQTLQETDVGQRLLRKYTTKSIRNKVKNLRSKSKRISLQSLRRV